MERDFGKSEKFQRRIIASFNVVQLIDIEKWFVRQHLSKKGDLKKFIDAREPDPKKALRLHHGISVIASIYEAGNRDFSGFHQALIWKTGPEDKDLTVEWKSYTSKFIVPGPPVSGYS